MVQRKVFDNQKHVYFIMFSCYRHRRLLDHHQAKQIVIHFLDAQLRNQAGKCIGFVIMPDHVHAIIHFEKEGLLSVFINYWKRCSSIQLNRFYLLAPAWKCI